MSTWTAVGPSAQTVQHAYVNARVHEINQNLGKDFRAQTIALFRSDPVLGARIKGLSGSKKDAYCADAFDRLTKILQSRELTINFKADRWFFKENPYNTYAQMYERGLRGGGRMILDDSDYILNPVLPRMAADDRVTFPTHWAGGPGPTQRGLTPGVNKQQIMGRMMAGGKMTQYGDQGAKLQGVMNPVPLTGSEFAAYESPNARFDAKTKQVFTAINYGRRPHGSSTKYGMSYMVVSPKFKPDALYYPGDTFYISGADSQVTYQMLGALYLKAKDSMRSSIIQSCFDGSRLPDTDDGIYLMEAHIFSELRFEGGVESIYVSGKDKHSPTGKSDDARPITGGEWQTIQTNARTFADKHKLRIFFIE